MNPLCLWRQRALAKAAVCEDSLADYPRLQEHLRHCDACRRFWNDLQNLTGALACIAEPLPVGENFTQRVWAEISLVPVRPRRFLALVPISAAVACTAFGIFLWNRLANSPETAIRQVGTEQAEKAAIDSALKTAVAETRNPPVRAGKQEKQATPFPSVKKRVERDVAGRDVPAQKRRWKRSEIRRMAHHSRRPEAHVAQKPVPRQPQSRLKQVAQVPQRPTPAQWQAWGVYYESQGDYERAAAAYGHAYAEQPDPVTGFAAGQAAESAGDVTQALVYYSQILKSTSEKKEPQKGTLLWSHENTSA